MSKRHFMLTTESPARLAVIETGQVQWRHLASTDDLEATAAAVQSALTELGWTGESLLLAPASEQCLVTAVSTAELPRRGRRKALLYRAEEQLPISAEEIVLDAVEQDAQALAVCIEAARFASLIDALNSRGVTVGPIVPLALLAAEHIAPLAKTDAAICLTRTDIIELASRRPARWQWLGHDPHATAASLTAHAADVTLIAFPGAHIPREFADPVAAELTADDAAAFRAADILTGVARPSVDLRRDLLAPPDPYQPYRRPASALVAALALLMLAVIMGNLWRADRFAQHVDELHRAQGEVFRSVAPGQKPPQNIKSRLLSERRKLEGLGGAATASAAGATGIAADPASASALKPLRDLLRVLVADQAFRITDIAIDSDTLRVDGEAPAHADAERLIAMLRADSAYAVDPPRTQILKTGGVSFSFTARRVTNAQPLTGRTP